MLIIRKRVGWGAVGGVGGVQSAPATYVVIHHGGNVRVADSVSAEMALLRSWEKMHMNRSPQPFVGLGYNFVAFESGRVYEGRGWGRVGAHAGVRGINSKSVGICYAVDGRVVPLSEAARDGIRDLIAEGVSNGHIAPNFTLTGHCDHKATECPGSLIYENLSSLDPRVPLRPSPPVVIPDVGAAEMEEEKEAMVDRFRRWIGKGRSALALYSLLRR